MRKMRRIFCLVLGMAIALSAMGAVVFAVPAEEASINSVRFLSNGDEIRALPTLGDKVSAEVSTDADALVLILAAYDDGGRLVDAMMNAASTVGAITMKEEIARIQLFTWSDMEKIMPISDQVYMLTDEDPTNPGALRSLLVNDIPAVINGDIITASVPVWDVNGDKYTQWTVKGTTKAGTGTISVGSVSLDSGAEQTMPLEPAKVTVTEDGQTAEYRLNLMYTIAEDFDTSQVFDDSYQMTGSATTKETWEQASIIGGNLAKNTFKLSITNTDEQLEHLPNIHAGVNAISEATKTDGTTPMDTEDTGARGKAFRVGKTTSINNDTNCGNPIFKIENSDLFSDTETPLTVEYDLAIDYSKVTEGLYGLNGGGVRYNGKEQYSLYDAYGVAKIPSESEATLKLRTNNGTSTSNTEVGAKINRWHHIKQVFDKTSNTATTYVNGTPFLANYDLSNASNYQNSLNLCFQTSSRRAADIWLDNIKVTWGKNYSGPLQGDPVVSAMNVAGQAADIDDENNLITVNIPLWDTVGEAVEAAAAPVTITANGNITVGGASVVSGTATQLDLSTAKQVIVSKNGDQKTYDMVINRTIFDDFDTNTVFSGEVVGSAATKNVWANDGELVNGTKASSVLQMNLVNGGIEIAAYQPYVSAAVAEISSAKGLDGDILAVGPSSGAKDKGLRLRKRKALSGSNTGSPMLAIKSDDFKDAKNTISIEYDLAFDYNNVTEGNRGMLGAGARYNNQSNYAISDNAYNKSAMPTDTKPRIYFGADKDSANKANAYSTSSCLTNAWIHVEIIIDVPTKNASKKITIVDTVSGKEESKVINNIVLDGGVGLNSGKEYVRASWNEQLNYTFGTSAQRGCDLWLDNLRVTYDVGSTK